MLAQPYRFEENAMARGRRKSKSSTLELVPDAWERFEKFMKSIVAGPSGSKAKSKGGSKRKTGGRTTGGRKAGRKVDGRTAAARRRKAARKAAASE
jgi:hypothetical protein